MYVVDDISFYYDDCATVITDVIDEAQPGEEMQTFCPMSSMNRWYNSDGVVKRINRTYMKAKKTWESDSLETNLTALQNTHSCNQD